MRWIMAVVRSNECLFEDLRMLDNIERNTGRILTVLFFFRALKNAIRQGSMNSVNQEYSLELVSLYLLKNLDNILNARDLILSLRAAKKSPFKAIKTFFRRNSKH